MKTISRIAYSNDKRNRTRSILIMMAICLATMLLVIISTVGNGVIHLQKSQAAGSYGSNYGLFVSADGAQLKEVNRRAEIDVTGTMCTEGIIKGNEKGGFVCMDETARKMLPYNKEYELKEGKYPEKMQEIAAGRAFFRAMGYGDVKIGDTVTLDYRAGMQSEYKPEEFVVSGILYDRDEYTIEASYVAFGSQEFYDEHVAENDRHLDCAVGTVVDADRTTLRSALLVVVDTNAIAAAGDHAGVNAVAAQAVDSGLTDGVSGQLGDESCVQAVVCQRDSNVCFAAAEGELQAVSLNETLIVEGLQTDHQLAKSNNSHWYSPLIYRWF